MTTSVRTLQGSKTKGFQGSTSLCPRGSNARGFSTIPKIAQSYNEHCQKPIALAQKLTVEAENLKLVSEKSAKKSIFSKFYAAQTQKLELFQKKTVKLFKK